MSKNKQLEDYIKKVDYLIPVTEQQLKDYYFLANIYKTDKSIYFDLGGAVYQLVGEATERFKRYYLKRIEFSCPVSDTRKQQLEFLINQDVGEDSCVVSLALETDENLKVIELERIKKKEEYLAKQFKNSKEYSEEFHRNKDYQEKFLSFFGEGYFIYKGKEQETIDEINKEKFDLNNEEILFLSKNHQVYCANFSNKKFSLDFYDHKKISTLGHLRLDNYSFLNNYNYIGAIPDEDNKNKQFTYTDKHLLRDELRSLKEIKEFLNDKILKELQRQHEKDNS